MRPGTTVLYICHNHPSVRPGGAEAYAAELYRAVRDEGQMVPYLLAKGGPPVGHTGSVHPGTYFAPVGADPNEYFFYTDGYEFDWFYGSMSGKDFYTDHFRDFLRAVEPDVVHFQHTLFLGYDLIREVHELLPGVPIVYTLHEYLPICHRNGQMVRVGTEERCHGASPRRCHECFPSISPQAFFLRERLIRSHLDLVDIFLAPSQFLADRFIDWGLPADRIIVEEYGRLPLAERAETQARPQRDRLGFFGQLNPFKGIDVLLEAMRLLEGGGASTAPSSRRPPAPAATLAVHGANLDLQPGEFQERIGTLLQQVSATTRLIGRYEHADLPALMGDVDWVVVPSTWWENSPLVIQEAFAHGRPIICSDVGGMAEKVTDGVNGLHFRAGDPASLARTIERAVGTPGLWATLREGIAPVHDMDGHVRRLSELYQRLLDSRSVGEAAR